MGRAGGTWQQVRRGKIALASGTCGTARRSVGPNSSWLVWRSCRQILRSRRVAKLTKAYRVRAWDDVGCRRACREIGDDPIPFSHYPKIVNNIVFAWVQPTPPDVDAKKGLPNFLGGRFSDLNRFKKPISPGESVVGYHDAQPFTRFYGSVFSSVSLELILAFSNDEVAHDGNWVTDDNIGELHYDAEALRLLYDPAKQSQTGKFFVTIYGRFLRVEIKNVGETSTTELRAVVRGSVF